MGAHERLLRDVVGVGVTAYEVLGEAPNAGRIPAHELGERSGVAGFCFLNELTIRRGCHEKLAAPEVPPRMPRVQLITELSEMELLLPRFTRSRPSASSGL